MNARDKEDLSFEEYQRDIESSHKRVTTLVNMIRETGEARVEHLTTLESLATGLISKRVDMRTLPDLSPSERAAIAVESGNFWAAITVGGGLALLIGGILNYFFGSSSGGGGGGGGGGSGGGSSSDNEEKLPDKIDTAVVEKPAVSIDIPAIMAFIDKTMNGVTEITKASQAAIIQELSTHHGVPVAVATRAVRDVDALKQFIADDETGLYYYNTFLTATLASTKNSAPLFLGIEAHGNHALTLSAAKDVTKYYADNIEAFVNIATNVCAAVQAEVKKSANTRRAVNKAFLEASGYVSDATTNIFSKHVSQFIQNFDASKSAQAICSEFRTAVKPNVNSTNVFDHQRFKSTGAIIPRIAEIGVIAGHCKTFLQVYNKHGKKIVAELQSLNKTLELIAAFAEKSGDGAKAAEHHGAVAAVNAMTNQMVDMMHTMLAFRSLTKHVYDNYDAKSKKGNAESQKAHNDRVVAKIMNLVKHPPAASTTNP